MKPKYLKLIILFIGSFLIYCCGPQESIPHSELDYKLEKIEYQIEDSRSENLRRKLENRTEFKEGQYFDYLTFIKERKRITDLMKKNVDPNFSGEKVRFEIDTTSADKKFSVIAIIEK